MDFKTGISEMRTIDVIAPEIMPTRLSHELPDAEAPKPIHGFACVRGMRHPGATVAAEKFATTGKITRKEYTMLLSGNSSKYDS